MSDFLFSLPTVQKISHHVELCQHNDIPILVVKHPLVNAAISLQGAHLLAWQPTEQQPVIWLSQNAVFKAGTAIRGGVPICWPWFGKVNNPSHGFARTMLWELVEHNDSLLNIGFTLQLTHNKQTQALWPHEFTLLAHFKLGHTCEIELEAIGDFATTAALHSYFHVQNIQEVSVSGLGSEYTDSLDGGRLVEQQAGDLMFDRLIDRVYTLPEPRSLINDLILDRTIAVKHIYASDVVVWNPWSELSIAMDDMADDGYKSMVCVETARINQSLVSTPDTPAILKVIFSVSN